MKKIFNKVKGYMLDKRYERKERIIEEKRAALETAYAYTVPTLTVAAATAMALSGNFSFM